MICIPNKQYYVFYALQSMKNSNFKIKLNIICFLKKAFNQSYS